MIAEDKLLILRCKRGDRAAFGRIYEKYEGDLRTLAASLMDDKAQDVVHDVFLSLLGAIAGFNLLSNLKGYLITCTANRSRDRMRARQRVRNVPLCEAAAAASDFDEPIQLAVQDEDVRRAGNAMKQLSYEQREAIVLYLLGEMKFKEIAKLQGVSIKTAHGRYHDGLERLRSILDSEGAR